MVNINDTITVGLDLGIASCGWAVLDTESRAVLRAGSWVFDAPEVFGTVTENGKQKKRWKPKNQDRRAYRGARVVTRRRRKRMAEIRCIFAGEGLLPNAAPNALWIKDEDGRLLDPFKLRADGLARRLSGPEFAVALGHIAKHRGFRSNSKRDRGANAPKEGKALLAGVWTFKETAAKYETVGEALYKDPLFAKRKRNREGDYMRTPLREESQREAHRLFERQRHFGNALATEQLEEAFIKIAFRQLPIASSEDRVGPCPFERDELRAARRSYSFERFRLLSRLATLKISGVPQRRLRPEDIRRVIRDFGQQKGLTFKRLRTLIDLNDVEFFVGVPLEKEDKLDVVARTGFAAAGSYALRHCLGETAWASLLKTPKKLDNIAFVLSFRDDVADIREGLEALALAPLILERIMQGVADGNFSEFRRAGHISAEAARNLIPRLEAGLAYSEACKAVGYDHTAPNATPLAMLSRPASRMQIQEALAETIGSPVARKAFVEALKQFEALVKEFGLPGKVHIELAREVGKSAEERDAITRGLERRTAEKERLREQFKADVGCEPIEGTDDMLRYELWKEQEGRCLYTDEDAKAYIDPRWLVSTNNLVQIDHILPWSRFCDDSYHNLTLCMAKTNQDKKERTPFEWFTEDKGTDHWTRLEARVQRLKVMKDRKKRNFLLQDAVSAAERSCNRNLNDTRRAARVFAEAVACFYPKPGRTMGDEKDRQRRVFTRPGPLTDRLRQAWGVQALKKVNGKRVSDQRHHALDAIVVAATSERSLQDLTKQFQRSETLGLARPFTKMKEPWAGFIEQMKEAFNSAFVARGERRRARGEAHGATIRQVIEDKDSFKIYERAKVEDLSLKDLDRIKGTDRNGKLVESIKKWVEAGKPKDAPPLSPKGDPIRKIKLRTSKKPDVLVRGGAADRGEMSRVDVFKRDGKFYLVPIYPHQVANKAEWPVPPNRAVQAGTPEEKWPVLDSSFEFSFSLYPFSYVNVIKSDGEVIEGYFRTLDRNTGAVTISPHNLPDQLIRSVGARTLKSFRKFSVDRLGRRHEIVRETRTWHGVACT